MHLESLYILCWVAVVIWMRNVPTGSCIWMLGTSWWHFWEDYGTFIKSHLSGRSVSLGWDCIAWLYLLLSLCLLPVCGSLWSLCFLRARLAPCPCWHPFLTVVASALELWAKVSPLLLSVAFDHCILSQQERSNNVIIHSCPQLHEACGPLAGHTW